MFFLYDDIYTCDSFDFNQFHFTTDITPFNICIFYQIDLAKEKSLFVAY